MKRVEAALSLYNQLQSNRATRELLYQKANTSLKSMLKNNQNFAIEIQESANNAAKQGQFGAFISIILGLCISLALAWLLSRSLAHSIKETQGTLEH